MKRGLSEGENHFLQLFPFIYGLEEPFEFYCFWNQVFIFKSRDHVSEQIKYMEISERKRRVKEGILELNSSEWFHRHLA